MAAKKQAEKEQAEELEIARKAMELEAEMEAKMTPDERARLERQRATDTLRTSVHGPDHNRTTRRRGSRSRGHRNRATRSTGADSTIHAHGAALSVRRVRRSTCSN